MENVQKKQLPPLRVAGIRTQGRYEACGPLFRKLGRYVGRFANGKPHCLHYSDYQPQTADFAACLPIRELSEPESRKVRDAGIGIQEVPDATAVCLAHHGPYEHLGTSYLRLLEYLHEKHGLDETSLQWPTREIYLKGPGIFFRGNPRKYVTEIQLALLPPGEFNSPRPVPAPSVPHGSL